MFDRIVLRKHGQPIRYLVRCGCGAETWHRADKAKCYCWKCNRLVRLADLEPEKCRGGSKRKPRGDMGTVTVSLDPETFAWLSTVAEGEGMTRGRMVVKYLKEKRKEDVGNGVG